MFFSVIIPAYNAEKFIKQCVTSVINQDFPYNEFEIIVVDDCSPDGQNQVVQELIVSNPGANIRLISHTENKRQGGARNTGVRAANGKWIFFLDADDYWTRTDVFKVFASEISRAPEVSVIESVSHIDVSIGEIISDNQSLSIVPKLTSGSEFFSDSGQYSGYVWTAAYLKELISEFPFRENVFFEDGDWKIKVFLACPKMIVIDYPFYAYLSNTESTIRMGRKDVFRANIDVNLIILKIFLEKPKGNLRDKGIARVQRNIFSWLKLSKGYSIKDSYKVLDYASSTELFNLSNYSLTGFEKITLLILKHFTLLTIIGVRAGVYTRRGFRKIIGKKI